jgi:hypothetical protein
MVIDFINKELAISQFDILLIWSVCFLQIAG